MRHLLAISFGLCLIVPFLGTGGWLHKEKSRIRKEVKHQILAGMDRSELVFLKFSQSEIKTVLRWEHAGEFEYQEQMYDIVESGEQGDSMFYWCWADHAETALNRHLDELIEQALAINSAQDHDQRQKNTKQVIDFLKTLYHDHQCVGYTFSQHHSEEPMLKSDNPYLDFNSAPPSPPPEMA